MPRKTIEFSVGLEAADQCELKRMIDELRRNQPATTRAERDPLQDQMDSLTRRLADLTEMVLKLDRQMAPLSEILRLSHQKSERLTQRLDELIAALKKGHLVD